MLVVMQPNASSADIDRVCEEITRQGFKPLPLPGEVRTAIGLLGDDAKVDWSYIEGLPGVSSVLIVQKPFRQASREWKPEQTIVEIAPGVRFGGPDVPIVAGPSHGTGLRDKVTPMARAAVAAGADGILVEMHPTPDKALSDGAQSLYPDQVTDLVKQLRTIATAIGRSVTSI